MKKIALFLLLFTARFAFAQSTALVESSPVPTITTIKIGLDGLKTSYPLLELGNGGKIELSFDDLEAKNKDYSYKIILCNADWTPTQLTEMEYIDGYSYDQLRDYHNSSRSLVNYIHYSVKLPNDNTKFLKSGNYIVKIYEDGDENKVVLVRRFMIAEPRVRILATVNAAAGKLRTHQELDFTIDHKGWTIRNPQGELNVVVLQNGRWDNAISGIKPVFERENQLEYNAQNQIVFAASKEWRRLDLTSIRYQTEGVQVLESSRTSFDAYTYAAYPMRDASFQQWVDANGKYVTLSQNTSVPDEEAEYENVHFALALPGELTGAKVYVFGALSNWECTERNQLTYNYKTHNYEVMLPLKQGFYNFLYAVVRDGDTKPNLSHLEGDWYETENDYTILVYQRVFGERYDRIIAAHTLNSAR
jgi:hypothetical protein